MPIPRRFSTSLIVAVLAALVAAACAPILAAPPHLIAAWPLDEAHLSIAPYTLRNARRYRMVQNSPGAAL